MNTAALRLVLFGGFLAGLADFIYPTVKTVMAGKPWVQPWKGVASGLLGQAARDGGMEMVLLGASLHFFICISAAFILYYVVSVQKPDWTIAYDHDAKTAQASRAAVIAQSAASGQRIYAVHFPFPGVGKFEKRGEEYVWVAE